MISDTEWWITGGTGWTDPWPHYMTTDVITFTGAGNASVAPGNNLPVARISHCIVKVADQEYFLGGGTSVGYFDDKAWYTLDLLKRGATEANPVMRAALDISDEAFVVIKTIQFVDADGIGFGIDDAEPGMVGGPT